MPPPEYDEGLRVSPEADDNHQTNPHPHDQAADAAQSNGQGPQGGRALDGYVEACQCYNALGWRGILKLHRGQKCPPPTGYTGKGSPDPTIDQIVAWANEDPDGNTALRMPEVVVGIDVDDYDNKTGGNALQEALQRWGPLPATWISSSRHDEDPVSGIRFFRIPAGIKLDGVVSFSELKIGDIEIIQRHHRFAVVYPSIHPEGRRYQWKDPEGNLTLQVPGPDQFPELPMPWLEALRKDRQKSHEKAASAKTRGRFDGDVAEIIMECLTDGEPSAKVKARLAEAVLACYGPSRHDHTRDHTLAMLRYGKQGEPGVNQALGILMNVFIAAVAADRTGAEIEAQGEFLNFFGEGAARLLSEPSFYECPPGEGGDTVTDDQTVKTVPWPTLAPEAMHGTAGTIVEAIAPHTEADPAALLVQLLAVFGATLGAGPYVVVGNKRHHAVIHPLIVGKTSQGAKGTGLDAVEAVRRNRFPSFDENNVASGLSTEEGLIERVRDATGEEGTPGYDPGVTDKRLLLKETEFRVLLARSKREGNSILAVLRQAFDGDDLQTLTRSRNRLRATSPHIVLIGHVSPKEFREAVHHSDMAGGSINRLLICLSRRARLHTRMGNIPEKTLDEAGELFVTARLAASRRGELEFTEDFWQAWDKVYPELNRDRPEGWATDATARGVTYVLRLALLYALFDEAQEVSAVPLHAALALWRYAEHSALWLFSSHEQEEQRESIRDLAAFILDGGLAGHTRTEISRDHFKRNKTAKEISAELTQLVHDGVVFEIKEETGARPITRYVHRNVRI